MGGGAMRAAAKVAGIGVANCGLRGIMAEHPVTSAARKAARPVPSISTSSPDDVKANLQVVSPKCSSPHRAWSEVDDWEFAGGEEDLLYDSRREQMPRLVFGGAPSFVEAQEATSELKDTLERVYLSSPTYGGGSYMADHDLVNSEMLETKSCLTSEVLASGPPTHAIQAFRFLTKSPAAQNVVASIASDPNVWNAVLQNPDLQNFLESHKSNTEFLGVDSNAADSDFSNQHSPRDFDVPSESEGSVTEAFADILKNIKITVIDMWSSLSDYFQNLFGGPATYNVYTDADGSAKIGFSDKALNASFLGLAVMAIVVVVLKRG